MKPGPDVLFVAGEESSDRHAAAVAKKLRVRSGIRRLDALGGAALRGAGVRLRYPLTQGGVVGVFEVLQKLSFFVKGLRVCYKIFRDEKPGVVVLVDFPDFNFLVARMARWFKIPVLYYICPQVWAWRPWRVRHLRRDVKKVLCIFPFEIPFLKKARVACRFVGHPLIESGWGRKRTRKSWPQKGPWTIGVLPGSRDSEVSRLLPALALASRIIEEAMGNKVRFVLFQGQHISKKKLQQLWEPAGLPVRMVKGSDQKARTSLDLALVASGTATLETALAGVPLVMVYRVNFLTYFLSRFLVRLPHKAMPNIILGQRLVPELIQSLAHPSKIASELLDLIHSPKARKRQSQGFARLAGLLQGPSPAAMVAEEIQFLLRPAKT